LEDTEEHDAPPSPDRQVPPFASNFSQVSKTPPTLRSATCKKPRVDNKPNKRRKRLSEGSVGLAKALSKFVETFAKIEAMKFEIQKEIALKTMKKSTCYGSDVCRSYAWKWWWWQWAEEFVFKKLRGGQREKI
jgi:hypothetical protein